MHEDMISRYANDRLDTVAPGLIASAAATPPVFSATAVTAPTCIWVFAAGNTHTVAAG